MQRKKNNKVKEKSTQYWQTCVFKVPLNQREPRSTMKPKHCWLQFTATCTERNILAKCMFSVSKISDQFPPPVSFYNLGGYENLAFQRMVTRFYLFILPAVYLPSRSVFSALVSSGNVYVVREKKKNTKPITLFQPFLFLTVSINF